MRENVAYHARSCVRNMTISVCGGFGEGLALDPEEHKDVVAAAVDGANGAIGIAAVALGEYGIQRKLARNTEESGASSVRVRFPISMKTSSETAYSYLRDLAESVGIGVVIFSTGEYPFWSDVLVRLADVPNVVGFSPPGDADFSDSVGADIQSKFPVGIFG